MNKQDMEQMVGHHVSVVSHLLQNKYNQKLSEFHLTMAQARVLYILVQNGKMAQSEIQKQLLIKGSTMNGIIDTMLKRELIVKEDSQEDRRTKHISLTKKGEMLENKLWDAVGNLEEELVSGFAEEEQKLLLSWLKRLRSNIEENKTSE
ncbi:MarR family transcriptional regulator [Bacillus shivajii]|uniref:MarR family winged helix-turn-helix transcriptional regulator n=1 Tax=Bacillus shivajii TaxID=1983719 RepID=UPI001CFB404A|nr:MarR family transcriptional regulator [Bacillus shivajii]UCZ53631.1 MarR family transcriptional regulator [Bacillus shivajii]